MAKLPIIDGVHRVRKRLASGQVNRHHYTHRGGKRFWSEPQDGVDPIAYADAYRAAKAARPITPASSIARLVTAYLASGQFLGLADRTRSDYRKWADRFSERFGEASIRILEAPPFRGKVKDWRDQWAHSPKQAQYAWTVAKIIANWAHDQGMIRPHVLAGDNAIYKADRAEIVWTPEDVAKFCGAAPEWMRRVLLAAIHTGLRPGDLVKLSRAQIYGNAIQVKTAKRKRAAVVPVLPEMRRIIDETPAERDHILAQHRGGPLTESYASQKLGLWARRAGVNPALTLNDARGTAATNLIRAGVKLDKMAVCMGWSIKHAAAVIEHYVSVDRSCADEVLAILEAHRAKGEQKRLL